MENKKAIVILVALIVVGASLLAAPYFTDLGFTKKPAACCDMETDLWINDIEADVYFAHCRKNQNDLVVDIKSYEGFEVIEGIQGSISRVALGILDREPSWRYKHDYLYVYVDGDGYAININSLYKCREIFNNNEGYGAICLLAEWNKIHPLTLECKENKIHKCSQ